MGEEVCLRSHRGKGLSGIWAQPSDLLLLQGHPGLTAASGPVPEALWERPTLLLLGTRDGWTRFQVACCVSSLVHRLPFC